MQEKNLFICWVKEHKKELIIAGVSAAAIAAIILGYKNREYLISIISKLDKKVDSLPQPDVLPIATPLVGTTKVEPSIDIPEVTIHVLSDVPQEIKSHLRNLPDGWNASAEKIATAAENGYSLLPGQTWVDSYTKNRIAA